MEDKSTLIPPVPDRSELVAKLVRGDPVPDALFDELFPDAVRSMSHVCWTPVEVAREVVRLIAPTSETRLLDVGSGPGKLCTIAALTAPGHYTGIEQKPELHQIALELGFRLGATRATFLLGDALDLDWSRYNALYLYNPFQEFLAQHWVAAAGLSVSSSQDWARYARATHMRLHQLAPGTQVAVFHGYGLDMPVGYEQVAIGREGSGRLALWRKVP